MIGWAKCLCLFAALLGSGVGCRLVKTEHMSCRVTLCINFVHRESGMPLIAVKESTRDGDRLMAALRTAENWDSCQYQDIYCCQVFETNGVPAFVTTVDLDWRALRLVQCTRILRTSYGYLAFPREDDIDDCPKFRSERFISLVEDMMREWRGNDVIAPRRGDAAEIWKDE